MRGPPTPHAIPAKPRLGDLHRASERNTALDLNTHKPATVIAFNPADQTARVRVDSVAVLIDPQTGAELPQKAAEITVPVVFPGDADAYLTWPIGPGTTGTLHVHDRDLAAWLDRPTPDAVVPLTRDTHAVHDAEFVPGLPDAQGRIPVPVDLTAIVLHHSTGIKLGRAAMLGVARLTDDVAPSTNMTAYMAAVVAALNTIAAAVPVVIVPPVPPALVGEIASASTKVKAE